MAGPMTSLRSARRRAHRAILVRVGEAAESDTGARITASFRVSASALDLQYDPGI